MGIEGIPNIKERQASPSGRNLAPTGNPSPLRLNVPDSLLIVNIPAQARTSFSQTANCFT